MRTHNRKHVQTHPGHIVACGNMQQNRQALTITPAERQAAMDVGRARREAEFPATARLNAREAEASARMQAARDAKRRMQAERDGGANG